MKRIVVILCAVFIVGIFAVFIFKKSASKKSVEPMTAITAERGDISLEFRVTGSVEPRNRLEIKPQVSGRLEEVLVNEGDNVKKGDILAWMSSTERTSLLDAAVSFSAEEQKKWAEVYKPTPIMAPLDGFIILRDKEPGQTVSVSDVILVMADKLIIKANVDETDLRYMRVGLKVKVYLDAYPDEYFPARVEHIAYESKVINNVTVYEVKIEPLVVPANFRAGMTATVEAPSEKKEDVLLLPVSAVTEKSDGYYVTLKAGEKMIQKKVVIGISSGRKMEIVSGITEDDEVMVAQRSLSKDVVSGRGQRGMRSPSSMFGIGSKKSSSKSK
ncbi:MAG: Macrolide export protein MacA [Elusimicrobia bacterium ADurb.Bin231]|nr:MAG: Macrolide export protein MacA [Elusimicrobia bacterium ADurb.Bin231]